MKIVVCVKYVPDAQADRRFAADLSTDRAGVDGRLSELDEYAVEEALTLAEQEPDSTVTVLTVGPEQAVDAIRRSLQMGAGAGVHVLDDALHGSDAPATSLVLARALERLGFDLVLTGMASTDGTMGVLPAMLSERLGVPQLTYAGTLSVAAGTATVERDGDASTEVIEAALPAVVSVTDRINTPRYPSLKGIMAAKKKPVETWTLADLDIPADQVGAAAAWTVVEEIVARPPRQAGEVITDDGDGGSRLVTYLAAGKLV
jgi:electron transfer flavoprotein beta subunit